MHKTTKKRRDREMEAKKASKILADYKKENVAYSYISHVDKKNGCHIDGLEIRLFLPISYPGGFEHALANKIARKYGINFEDYNVNRGREEPAFYKPIFSTVCNDEDDIKTKIEKIIAAREELKTKFEDLAKFAMKS